MAIATALGKAWHAFGIWRRTRPFWGGLLVSAGGCEIVLSEHGPLDVVIHVGMQGLAGYLVPVMLLLCGILLWFTPAQRPFYSLLAIVLSLGSWLTSNLGGFFLGMALGLVGGTLAFAWSTSADEPIQWPRTYPQILQPSAVLGLMLRQPPALPSGRADESVVVLESASLAPPARPLPGGRSTPWSAELMGPAAADDCPASAGDRAVQQDQSPPGQESRDRPR